MHSAIPFKLKIKVFGTAGLPAGGESEKVARTGSAGAADLPRPGTKNITPKLQNLVVLTFHYLGGGLQVVL